MSRKAYSQQERTALKKRLHEIGLDIYLKQGIQNVKLPEILQLAGISKPFCIRFCITGSIVFSSFPRRRRYGCISG